MLLYEEFQQTLHCQSHESLLLFLSTSSPQPPTSSLCTCDMSNSMVAACVPLGPPPLRKTHRVPCAFSPTFPTLSSTGSSSPLQLPGVWRACPRSPADPRGWHPLALPKAHVLWPLQRETVALKESFPTARAVLTPLQ